MKRVPLLIANWKLNHTRASASDFFAAIKHVSVAKNEVAIAPVAPMLEFVGKELSLLPIALAAQNVFYAEKGAFTGEWSAEHLRELAVQFCIIGHSERRTLFNETDEAVSKKAIACVLAGIHPVICVGETQNQRMQQQTFLVIKQQMHAILEKPELQKMPLIFAYEPLWAIGTGNVATSEQIMEVHGFMRGLLEKMLKKDLANSIRILYGGSVTPHNIKEIVSLDDVDGALVGGASLQAASFLSMVETLQDI